MGNKDVNNLIKYIKAIIFDVRIKEDIPEEFAEDNDFLEIDQTIKTLRESVRAIGIGDLLYNIKGKGYIVGTLKNLQASLKTLKWQTKAVASGDFSQSVDFLGEFSDAFNSMTRKLEASIEEVKDSKEYFEMLFQAIPDPTIITSIDNGDIFEYNEAFVDITGYTKEEIESKNTDELNFYISQGQREYLILELRKNGFFKNMEAVFQNKNKEQINAIVSSKFINIKGTTYILSVIRDITHLKEIEKRLRESEERHRLLADNASDVIWTMDLEGKFTYISPSVEKLRGYSVEEVLKQSQEEVLCPSSLIHMKQGLENAIKSVQNNQPFKDFRGELEQPCKDGSTVWTEVTVSGMYNEEGGFIGMLGVTRNITKRKKMEKEIIKLSITDKLTQLYNRLKLDETFENELARSRISKKTFSIILLDIDHFKLVNDTFGHQVGDTVLVEIANILKNNVGSTDVIGRWGGEEFLIILPEVEGKGGKLLAEKLRAKIDHNNFMIAGHLTSSFGVAVYKDDISPASMVSRADEALYKAKENGRNRVEFL
ncbi:diguanylate cyclase [Clostridium vincentii]|uniref:Putative diguanylate cyclase YegE n=1 Tax=Clostridium vincentii TaxID=52704 RepID=A0A2T0BIG6_9CLOT|nr:diguanylate cyclase [Clostridium vincentii]PRR83686.1 putative diguanylate cyclase YegE [Clostridium vincentii]